MIYLKFVLFVFALFITLLWFTKLVTDCVSAIFGGNLSKENAEKDATLRIYMITIMSILWPIIILM
jgi:hypothetical protein